MAQPMELTWKKLMKSYLYILVSCLFCYLHEAKAQDRNDSTRTLAECIAIAVANNPLLQQNNLNNKRNDVNYRQAWQNQLPLLDATFGHGYSQGKTIDPTTNQFVQQNITSGNQNVNAGLILFDGMRILNDVRMKASAKTAGRLEYEGQINALKLDVIEAYIQVLTAQDMLDLNKQQLELTKEQLRRSEVLNLEGAIAPADYYDVKGQYSLELNNQQLVKQQLYTNKLNLANLLNCSEEDLGNLENLPFVAQSQNEYSDWKNLYSQAGSILPEFKALEWRIKEAEQGIRVSKASYYPQLSVGAGLYSNYSNSGQGNYFNQIQDNLGRSLSFNLSIPIFSRFITKNQVNLSKITLKEMELEKDAQLNNLRKNTSQAIFDLKIAEEQVKNLNEQEKSYAEFFRISQVQFDAGANNSVDYLSAKNKWDNSKNQLVIKQYEWLFQKYLNDYYAGKLNL
ncbi:TolC family protein [Sphingobacterium hungaricum]|nr:TolC family protein [Sphingobacterium hungaricum]